MAEFDDDKFPPLLWVLLAIWFVVGMYACESESPYGPGCYDADPTQYVDVICDE